MADAETMTRRVQVANLPPADSGRGVARLPVKLMTEIWLAEGDVIDIVGKRATAARAIRPYGDDEGLDIIRLDWPPARQCRRRLVCHFAVICPSLVQKVYS